MYEAYYHMQSKAFPAQPTPAVFFESRIHQGAFHYLTNGVEEHEPFLLLLGRYGMGKTLLCLRLLRYLRKEEHPFLNIPTPVVSYRELLEHILHSWGVTPLGDSDESLQTQLFHYMDRHLTPGRYFSVILDEVQDYQLSTLAKIRMLSNYNCDGFYPFQFIFFGHPDVLELLNTPPLASLHQRIRRRYTLTPFSFEETREYIYYRLLESGARGSPYFPDDTLRIIHARSEGIPRLINNLCDTCLLIGAAKASSAIDRQTALDAADTLGLSAPKSASDTAADAVGTDTRTTGNDDESAERETDAPAHTAAADEENEWTDAEDQADSRRPSKQTLRSAAQILPPWAWRTVGALLIFLLGWILALHVTRLLAPHAPRSQPPARNEIPAAEADPRNEAEKDGQPANSAPEDARVQAAEENASTDPLPDSPSTTDDSPKPQDEALDNKQSGLLGYLGNNTANRPATPEANPKLDGAILRASKSTSGVSAEDEDSQADSQTSATDDDYPFSLQLRAAPERRQAVEQLWELRENGAAELYIGRLHADDDDTPAWAVLLGQYPDKSQAQKAKERLQLDDATPVKTPYAVQIPVANTGDDAIHNYLREAGFWPYSTPNSQNGDRLLVGAFETREMAENWKQEMETRGFEAQTVSR